MTFRTIVAVPGSSGPSDAALATARSLADWYGATLHIAGVTEGFRALPGVFSGGPVREIAEFVERVGADLVVVSRQARPRSGYLSAGSFAAAVGRAVKVPTLAVAADSRPREHEGEPFRNILTPVDFSDPSRRALSQALALVQRSGGYLRLLHVLDGFPYDDVYSGARAFRLIGDFRARVTSVNRQLQSLIPRDAREWSDIDVATVSGRAPEAVVSAAVAQGADLVVLGLPQRSRMEELAAGSTVTSILRRTAPPVLLVPETSASRLTAPQDDRAVGIDGELAAA